MQMSLMEGKKGSKQLLCFISPCTEQEETISQVVKKNAWLYSCIAPAAKAASTLRFIVLLSWIRVIILGLVLSLLHKQHSIFLNFCPVPQGPTKNNIHRIAESERILPCLVQKFQGEGYIPNLSLLPLMHIGTHMFMHTVTHSHILESHILPSGLEKGT